MKKITLTLFVISAGLFFASCENSVEPTDEKVANTTNPSVTSYKVTFDAKGGTVDPAYITVKAGETIGTTLPQPLLDGHDFRGWFTKAGGEGDRFTSETQVNGNITVYASWSKVTITSFSFANPAATGVINGTGISVIVPEGTVLTSLVPTIVHTGASISPASGTAQDFSGPVTYTVTAAGGTKAAYTVTVVFANSTKEITDFSFANPAVTGVISETDISVTVPYGTNLTALVPTITHNGASISPASGTARNFSLPVTYTVTAEDGTTLEYTVTVTPEAPVTREISLVYPKDEAEYALSGTIILSKSNGQTQIPLTVEGEFDTYRWRVDGANRGSGKTFTLDAAENYMDVGVHQLSLEVTRDGNVYSKSVTFTVTD
jgi:uncharacterized repeat protein (TIGR02543 family)